MAAVAAHPNGAVACKWRVGAIVIAEHSSTGQLTKAEAAGICCTPAGGMNGEEGRKRTKVRFRRWRKSGA
jgi:hypothetical protein